MARSIFSVRVTVRLSVSPSPTEAVAATEISESSSVIGSTASRTESETSSSREASTVGVAVTRISESAPAALSSTEFGIRKVTLFGVVPSFPADPSKVTGDPVTVAFVPSGSVTVTATETSPLTSPPTEAIGRFIVISAVMVCPAAVASESPSGDISAPPCSSAIATVDLSLTVTVASSGVPSVALSSFVVSPMEMETLRVSGVSSSSSSSAIGRSIPPLSSPMPILMEPAGKAPPVKSAASTELTVPTSVSQSISVTNLDGRSSSTVTILVSAPSENT